MVAAAWATASSSQRSRSGARYDLLLTGFLSGDYAGRVDCPDAHGGVLGAGAPLILVS